MKISVIIATHHRPDQVVNCLACLDAQTFPREDFEIILVDDFSPVPLSISRREGQLPYLAVYRTAEKSGPGLARNLGASYCRGQLLVFTDDDCLPDPRWLETLWAHHQQSPDVILGGKLYNAVPDYLGAEASQLISNIVYEWYNRDPLQSRFFSTNNFAMPAAGFRAMEGFHAGFRAASEDRDFCARWIAAGRKMHYVPSAIVGHAHKLTVRKFIRQHFHYGRGAATFHTEKNKRQQGIMTEELPFHGRFSFLVWKHLRKEPVIKCCKLVFMCVLWQLANAAGFFYELRRIRKRAQCDQEMNTAS